MKWSSSTTDRSGDRASRLGVGNPHNDYGPGFYCTKSCDMACEWACTADSDGYANRYQLDEDGLTIFDLSSDEYHILNWLAILLQNRIFKVDGDLAADACDYVLNRYLPPYESFDVIVAIVRMTRTSPLPRRFSTGLSLLRRLAAPCAWVV